MKQTKLLALLFAAMLFATSLSFAGSKRMVLVEEATNASCAPCAQQNPAFQAYLNENLKDVIPVVYHASWPGGNDPMYLKNTGMNNKRVGYYGFGGVPAIAVNGEALGAPSNVSTGVSKWKDMNSPITLEVFETRTDKKMDITVNIATDEAISGKLRIVVCEQYHYYDNAGNNGEKDFYYLARKMLPDNDGVDISLEAGGTDNFIESYTIDDHFNADRMYVVAYIQNDDTKEVLQASTNLKIYKSQLSVDANYFRIDPNTTVTKTIKIDNPIDQNINVTVAKATEGNIIPDGWEINISQTNVPIMASSSANVDVTIKAPAKAGFCRVNIEVNPQIPGKITLESTISLNALSKNTKYAVYPGTVQAYKLYDGVVAISKYSNETALIPISNETFINFPPQDFEIGIFAFDYWNRGVLSLAGTLNSVLMPGIKSMISNNKKVLIFSEIDITLAAANPNASSSYFNSFVQNELGLQLTTQVVPHIQTNDQGQITTVYANKLTGIAGDEISAGMDYTFNQGYSLPNDLYSIGIYSDNLTLKSGSESTLFLNYNSVATNGAAIRTIRDESRIIYCSFDPKAIQHDGSRNGLISKLLLWLDKKVVKTQPVIAVSTSSVNFEKVPVGSTKEMEFTIESKGSEPLKLEQLEIEWDEDVVYSLIGLPSLPLTIEPDQSIKVKVKFAPKEQKTYTGAHIYIKCNDPDNSNIILDLAGVGEPVSQGPKISLSKTSLDFGEVVTIYSSDKTFDISNLGGESLVVDEILLDNNSDNSFAFVDLPTLPLMIEKGKSKPIKVRFTPKAEKNYSDVVVRIESNDDSEPTKTLAINASGKNPLSVEEEAFIGKELVELSALPNVISSTSRIEYKLNSVSPKHLTLNVIDQAGRIVAQLIDGQVSTGLNTVEFNATALASGSYFLVARSDNFTTQIPLVIKK